MNANMKAIVIIFGLLFLMHSVHGFNNPDLEYELISGGPQVVPKGMQVPITQRPIVIHTPPPVDPNSKTFLYDPKEKGWTEIRKNDPQPTDDETLLWNQSNDKWLTRP